MLSPERLRRSGGSGKNDLRRSIALGLACLATAPSALAQEQPGGDPIWSDEDELEEGRKVRDDSRYRSARNGAVELRLGPYRPRVDSEFASGATPFEDLFGPGFSVGLAIEGDWQALKIPHFGSFGPGFSIGYVRYDAQAFTEPMDPSVPPSERSAQPTSLWIIPTYAVGVLRIDVFAVDFRIPIVPYVKGGFAHNFWQAADAGDVSEENGVAGRGNEFGIIGMVGGMLLLDFFAPQAALDMDNITGVNHAYLFGEWMFSDVSRFGTGMQTGTNTWQAGLALEF